ncbi:MAG: activase [Burkholderiales bacterium]|nr:activase [Burkholderiales bacterium]
MIGAKFVQEVVAVAAAVEKLHPDVRFVSEIGGEDMKTVFFTPTQGGGRQIYASSMRSGAGGTLVGKTTRKLLEISRTKFVPDAEGEPIPPPAPKPDGSSKQVFMQSACSGGTGTFIEKTARKLGIPLEDLAGMRYGGHALHRISSKCGIFAETDANTLVKSGVPVEEIIASLYEAVVYQNLATLTKGNTPAPKVLLLGGPNLFFAGLQEAWRHHLRKVWTERGIALPGSGEPEEHIVVPDDALYYAGLGCVEVGAKDSLGVGVYAGRERLRAWVEEGQHAQKAKEGSRGLAGDAAELESFLRRYARPSGATGKGASASPAVASETIFLGCDFGSTTVKAVVLAGAGELVYSCYALSRGNPIEDAKAVLRDIRAAGYTRIGSLGITGYGKDLLKDIVGADVGVVETVAHATAALHYFPDADVICDVGGCDVKIMLLRQGTVSDFRLNSQCSSGNGAFLQGVAERYAIPLEEYAERAFKARAIPTLAMGCGVFLQSDIVNQQRKGWAAEEIMASLAAVLPLNVWVYAGQLQNLAAAGRKFVLQGGTHRNLAVVKAQVDFIGSKVPNAEIVVHPQPGEAGAIGAALCALDWSRRAEKPSRFRGFDAVEALVHRSTTNEHTTCNWCAVNCRRTFIDVQLSGAKGRSWSKVPVEEGWERVISGNSCPKGLLEDANEMRIVKAQLEEAKRVHPNVAELVREDAFRRARSA